MIKLNVNIPCCALKYLLSLRYYGAFQLSTSAAVAPHNVAFTSRLSTHCSVSVIVPEIICEAYIYLMLHWGWIFKTSQSYHKTFPKFILKSLKNA